MSVQDPIEDAFEAARQNFLSSLKDQDVYNFSQFTSINDVYNTTDKIQEEQRTSGALRGLNRIRPYLDCLSQYVGVLDTFTQVKPDILCLIWVCHSTTGVAGYTGVVPSILNSSGLRRNKDF